MDGDRVDRQGIHEDLERARTLYHDLVSRARPEDLRRRTAGTRWTNRQLLFHMFFGYLVVRRLLRLVRLVGRLPEPVGRGFARVLDAGARPFHTVNYLGSCGGGLVVRGEHLLRWFDRTLAGLHEQLDAESEESLRRSMPFPVRWDPLFRGRMSLEDVYRYGTEHFDVHRHQLTLPPPD